MACPLPSIDSRMRPRRAPSARPSSSTAICSMSSTALCCWKCVAMSLISASFCATRWLWRVGFGVFDGDGKLVDHLLENRLIGLAVAVGREAAHADRAEQPTARANRRDHHRAQRLMSCAPADAADGCACRRWRASRRVSHTCPTNVPVVESSAPVLDIDRDLLVFVLPDDAKLPWRASKKRDTHPVDAAASPGFRSA